MDNTESGPEFDRAHEMLDALGRTLREKFPKLCALSYSDGQYSRTCPVDLAHIRAGLSPGFIIKSAECSICHADPSECPHIRGETYDGETCLRIIKDVELLEISLVDIPAQPDARIQSISVSREALKFSTEDSSVSPVVTCNRCLKGCQGLRYPARDQNS
ncbi:HK97 family phage prohead protease [Amycolatopsis keratiniphila]|uniref:HK97 family phage prohead protease n=1 Tax=Amycolatopsis keratiniphila TaxID=129921 RepID=UPI0033EFE311